MNATQEIRPGIEVICINRVHINADFTMKPGGVGMVVSINKTEQTAGVEYKVPNLPDECQACGRTGGLSRNGGTGEIECMNTGCGHKHGFQTISVKLPLSSLKKKG